MLVRVLGPLVVEAAAGSAPVTGRPAAVLAALVQAAGSVLTPDRLHDWLWDGEPPTTARAQIHKAVAALRRSDPGLVQTVGAGYRLDPSMVACDTGEFLRLQRIDDLPSVSAALGLWRGPALAGLDGRRARAVAAGWEERRLDTVERWAQLSIAAGRARDVVATLADEVAANPTRESLVGRMMTALHSTGRTAEAIEQFARLRTVLADRLGADPGPGIAALHAGLLRGEHRATGEPASTGSGPDGGGGGVHVSHAIPYEVQDFAGRAEDLRLLRDRTSRGGILALDGMPGVGKTTVAIQLAHRIADRYPDGQFYLDLRAHTPGATAVDAEAALGLLLGMAGIAPTRHPDGLDARAALWRSTLAGRRVLLVIDNAPDVATVLPLLPGDAASLVVVTSRSRLAELDGAHFHTLDVLDDQEAEAVLGQVLRAGGRPPETLPAQDLSAVAGWCGGLPLAIRLVAGRLTSRPGRTLAELSATLLDDHRRQALWHDPAGRIHRAFIGSVELLDTRDRRTLLMLARSPMVQFDATATAALMADRPAVALASLERLTDAHLLEATEPGYFRFHDLVRDFAIGESVGTGTGGDTDSDSDTDSDTDSDDPDRRLYDYYLATAVVAADLLNPVVRRFDPQLEYPPSAQPPLADRAAALAWFRREHATLVRIALVADDWQLPVVLRVFFEHQGHFADWLTTHEHAARRAGDDQLARGLIAMSLGALHGWRGDHRRAIAVLRQAVDLLPDRPDLQAAAYTTTAMHLHLSEQDAEATDYAERALALPNPDAGTSAMGWCNLALATARLGDGQLALAHHATAIDEAERSGDLAVRCAAQLGLGETRLRLGRPATAAFEAALVLAGTQGNRMQQAIALDGLAHATGDPAHWSRAREIFTDLGVPQADLVARHLDDPGRSHCDLCAGFRRPTPPPAAPAPAGRSAPASR